MDPYLAPGALVPSLIASSRETPWGTLDSDLADQNEHEAASNTEKKSQCFSAPGVTRTRDTRIRNPALYPPELRGPECFQVFTGVRVSAPSILSPT